MDYGYVNGFAYSSARPAPEEEIPQRFQRAEEVFEQKLWREQLRDWDETFKPASIKAHRELQSVDPDALSDEDLVAYLARCRDHHAEMIYQHMRFTAAAMLPIGDLLAHVGDWTGSAARRAARHDAGRGARLGGRVGRARAADRHGHGGSCRAAAARVGRRAAGRCSTRCARSTATPERRSSAYLDLVGYRLLDGFDIGGRYALELPDVLLRAIRAAVEQGGTPASDVEDADRRRARAGARASIGRSSTSCSRRRG